jgi:hypothetical protein
VPTGIIAGPLTSFLTKWPRASAYVTLDGLRQGTVTNRLYEVEILEWVLHDEINFPTSPRQVIAPQ